MALAGTDGVPGGECNPRGFPFFNLYRLAVIARGDRLIEGVSRPDGADPRWAARTAMHVFDAAFSLNLDGGRFGWQMLALARLSS